MDTSNTVYTIGHSSVSLEQFLSLLKAAAIEAIADVRSSPYSRRNPQFNRESLKAALNLEGIAYSWLGDELGGRPKRPQYFCEGVADYRKMRTDAWFEQGLARIDNGLKSYRIALMCAERNPLECHRCLLVGRALHNRGKPVIHLLHDGSRIAQTDVESELLRFAAVEGDDLFASIEERLDAAYWAQNRRNAFSPPSS